MGLFSSIGKIFKKVVKGVGKVFKKAVKFVGKIVNSKWFKYVMIAAAIVTAGVALYAGVTAGMAASAQGATLMNSFVTGSKAFMTALVNPISTAKAAFGGELSVASRLAAAGTNAATAGLATGSAAQAAITGPGVTTTGLGAAPTAATTELGVAGTTAGSSMMPGVVTPPVGAPVSGAGVTEVAGSVLPKSTPLVPLEALPPAPANPGMLAKGVKAVTGFLGTTGGSMLLAGALQGYGAGKVAEEALKEKQRIEGLWNDPTEVQAAMDASSQPIAADPAQWNAGAQASAPWRIRNVYGYPPSVPFTG